MLVYVNNTKDNEEFNSHGEQVYVYKYNYDDDQQYKEKLSTDINTYEIYEEEHMIP